MTPTCMRVECSVRNKELSDLQIDVQNAIASTKSVIADNEKTIAEMARKGFSSDEAYWKGVKDAHKDTLRLLQSL